ncbi:proteasomal ubiquitin receptor ADRM1 homolog [Thrips palmi]|uniref:Proteasomal ubiquitin receptor ADRM1 homolog n=1 Tax=Thrips palmi TaxID=161013 RepID=A0A6P9A749_THRPL|nr:proteasomal ubiquitin receptor ADRM1 homolog [Thrips palmi]
MPGGGALFGNSSSRSQNKNLVEFKAGKMTMKGKIVHPDKRKGLLYVYQSEESLMHFCWKDRQTGTIEDDLIIFPDDCEFKRVNQCTTGRVYVLKFKSSNKKFFFWVQEPKTDKDDENCRRLNEILNNPPTNRSGGGTPDSDIQIQNLLSNMSQQQLVQLFGGGGLSSLLGTMNAPRSSGSGNKSSSSGGGGGSGSSGSSSTPATASSDSAPSASTATASATSGSGSTSTPTSSRTSSKPLSTKGNTAEQSAQNPIQLNDLRNFLSTLGSLPDGDQRQSVDLAAGLNTESIQPLLSNPAVVRELQQHLPSPIEDSGDPQERLRLTLTSPQFQQALSSFSDALQSGQIGHVINQFDVDGDAVSAANRGNMEDFVRALQRTSITGSPSTPSAGGTTGPTEASPGEVTQPEKKKKMDNTKTPDKKKDDDDEGMSMD